MSVNFKFKFQCKLVKQRRSIMSTQIRLRREQDKKFQVKINAFNLFKTIILAHNRYRRSRYRPLEGRQEPESFDSPTVEGWDKHVLFLPEMQEPRRSDVEKGIHQSELIQTMLPIFQDHKKNCEYANCRCEQCDLIDTRRALDRHIKNNKGSSPARGSLDSNSSTGSSTRESSSEESCSSSAISSLLPTPVPTSIFSISNLMQSSQPVWAQKSMIIFKSNF